MTYRLIKSIGALNPSPDPPGPDERMTPLPPPVMRTTSRAFVKKFWRNRRETSAGRDGLGKRAGEYMSSSYVQPRSVGALSLTRRDKAVEMRRE